MAKLAPGLYEQLINDGLSDELARLPERLEADSADVDGEEAPKVLAAYVGKLVEGALSEIKDSHGSAEQQESLVNDLVATIQDHVRDDGKGYGLDATRAPRQLLSVVDARNSVSGVTRKPPSSHRVQRPQTSIASSSLFTGSPAEPQLMTEIKKEIATSDRIDLLVSFIKWNGLRQILPELEEFANHGGRLRVITTTYIGATDYDAVEALRQLPNTQVKIAFDAGRARMHAKAYIFVRDTGFTTAYIGSSNISVPALTSGLEWNVKIGRQDQADTLAKVRATFESYWADDTDFVIYDETQQERLRQELKHEKNPHGGDGRGMTYLFDIHPYAFQQAILDQLEAEREVRGHHRNLVVAATGTGKTVISAFDYRRFCEKHGGVGQCRLLFVAHREEILKQSISCYRGVLKDENFGDLFVGTYEPDDMEHVFMSIQTLNSRHIVEHLDPDYYDFIVVDEFHHAAAKSYQDLLNHFAPQVLLGLTGTPERLDGKDVTDFFDGRIAAEIRLPEAINRKLLCPFQYFGVSDGTDLSQLKWSRGGYEETELENLYVLSGARAKKRAQIINDALRRYVKDIDGIRGLGFCVSIKHAEFMAEQFTEKFAIPSIALSSQSSESERDAAKTRLVSGEVKFIFVVDLYNEGVDIPQVNTIMFLRPTESLTVFLQQLGRGLRNSDGKDCLTVLDFVGQANRHYDFSGKFEALLGRNRKGLKHEIEEGFPSVPKGCYIQLERKAKQDILENISHAFNNKNAIVSRIRTFEDDAGVRPTLRGFTSRYQLDARAIYKTKRCFARLCVDAGVRDDFDEPIEEDLSKALLRIAAIDSRRWLDFLIRLFETAEPMCETDLSKLTLLERAWVNMFQVTIWRDSFERQEMIDRLPTPLIWINQIRSSPVMRQELLELLHMDLDRIDFVDEPVILRGSGPAGSDLECPIDLHCQYSRDQILVALGCMQPTSSREGVKQLKDIKTDVLFNTLNKSEKDYSPSTMYEDYSVNESLFHWQSQSTTSEESVTGQRYIHHVERGSHVLLFVREYDRDAFGFTMPLTFLGLARYVSHEGSRPMSILWHLERPIPAKFLPKTQKLIA